MPLFQVLLAVLLCVVSLVVECNEADHSLLTKGHCKGMWRPEHLVGVCFGLREYKDYPQLKNITVINTGMECMSLCCNLDAECISWQFESTNKVCKLGGKVRLGLEQAQTNSWCEPHPPSKWNGGKIVSKENGKCVWGGNLDNQCFGLGPERFNSTKGRLDTEGCRKACCDIPGCLSWQEMPGRGCYYSDDKNVHGGVCGGVKDAVYDGARKCLPGYCGGMESTILKNHSSSHERKDHNRLRRI